MTSSKTPEPPAKAITVDTAPEPARTASVQSKVGFHRHPASSKEKKGRRFHVRDLKFLLGPEFLFGWIILGMAILVTVLLVVFRKELLPPVIAFADKIRGLGIG
ncbi:hypothetical protein HDU67_001656, partial [Dinochytrium kinnereticum]